MITTKFLALVLLAPLLPAAPGAGVKYAARDPQECAARIEPAKGVLSPALAVKYFACNVEHESGGSLYLVENVKIEIGKGTPFLELDRSDRPSDGDSKGLVYSIRGSMQRYQCSPVSDYMKNAGKNCNIYEEPKSTGTCYRTNFGDWACNMRDPRAVQVPKQAPPPRK